MELGPKGIRVNSINPAVIDTPIFKSTGMEMSDEQVDKLKEFARKTYPIRRVGSVDDTSKAIAFLPSDAASFITGTLLPIDGGYLNVSVP